jgi:hypothetical protein
LSLLNFLIPTKLKPPLSREAVVLSGNWALKAFSISTIFIVFFSIGAIHSWPPFVKRFSILLACIVPSLIIFSGSSTWNKVKQTPKEIIWLFSLFTLGLISSLLSADQWGAFKSIVLFIAAGPLIFVGTRYLFESKKNQEVFLWINSLIFLSLCLWGIYEHNFDQSDFGAILLFSENPLPAGTLLILLSASPMVLLRHSYSQQLKLVLSLSLIIALCLIIFSAKKSHLLGLIIIFFFLMFFIQRKKLKFLMGFILISGISLYFSDSTFSKYKNLSNLNSSILLRAENYFFGLHVFKKNPIWGVGFKSELTQHLEDYELKFPDKIIKSTYHAFIKHEKTFENIVLAFFIEWGSLFSFVYFSGLTFIFTTSWRKINDPPKNLAGILIISVLVGFAAISLTFDTLRTPDINWAFHSLLGLMINISNK